MKLREYGFILWQLSHNKDTDSEAIGMLAYDLAPLVEDWSVDNSVRDSNNADWLTEPYNDWVSSQEKKSK